MELMNSWEKKGMEKGLQQGLQRGRTEAQLEIAKRLLKMGMSLEDVVKATGVEQEEIEQLAKQEDDKV